MSAEAMNSDEKPNLEQLTPVDIDNKNGDVCSSEKLSDLIHEGMDRVCLASGAEVIDCIGSCEAETGDQSSIQHHDRNNLEILSDGVKNLDENEVKNVIENNAAVNSGGDLVESEEDESSSSSSSSSSDADDDEESDDDEEDDEAGSKKANGEVEIEEGEVRDEVDAWSDDEDGCDVKGPIRSKNEIQDLPPVPAVTVTIQPHHQTLPVGVVLSIIGTQVIVEGVENHNPLNEGSILWITESRSPLGAVDEIFGPVKNPYYSIRYNSETDIPTGIQQGSLISFVPEFADYVLSSNNNLYKKGYDASGENDEELSEEFEFSDDEKEAEYKKMIKMSKRGSNEHNMKRGKKSKNRGGKHKNNHQPLANSPVISSSSQPVNGPQALNLMPCVAPDSGAFAFWHQNNFNQSQVQPPMGLQHGVASMPNVLEMENNNGESRPNFNQDSIELVLIVCLEEMVPSMMDEMIATTVSSTKVVMVT
ncbi:hypothetical protein E3N88_06567 [Mikania micrantha]|uniref:H/ACA ribonucleoprotein complex non-core subunit NAF1 n=1 Tax=Mikania micrantha TaxID=192012 RepID=A0A5N6PPU2_9ASTR|nr:hypothetical protein E3N88_06567 [Mikania micrantha]